MVPKLAVTCLSSSAMVSNQPWIPVRYILISWPISYSGNPSALAPSPHDENNQPEWICIWQLWQSRGGLARFQGGMIAPPKGFQGNFTAAPLHHQSRSTPPPQLSYQTVKQRRGGSVRARGKTVQCSCHQHHPLLSTSLLSSAGVLMIHFPPDIRKLLAQRKKAVNQCYWNSPTPLAGGNRSCALA